MENIKNEKEEVKNTKGYSERAKKGMITLAAFGIGCGLYGYKVGRRVGQHRGIEIGMAYSNAQMFETIGKLIEANKESKGE